MKAFVVPEDGDPRLEDVSDPDPAVGRVIVRLICAALNHRDIRVCSGSYPYRLPLIPGSDGAGIRLDTGEEVVIHPSLNWGSQEAIPGSDFEILGGPTNGTLAELVAVPVENVFPKPARLTWEEAAALPLAALTAYRALFRKASLQSGESVLIPGIGGGVATYALHLALAAGARVYVTSGGSAKLRWACEHGAQAGFSYLSPHWPEELLQRTSGHGVDVAIDSAAADWRALVTCLTVGGRLVSLGATSCETVEVDVRDLYRKHLTIQGTMMGSSSDFADLLQAVEWATWRPTIDSVWDLADIAHALSRLRSPDRVGKLVVRIA